MLGLGTTENKLREIIREAVEAVAKDEEARLRRRLSGFRDVESLQQKVLALKENVEDLEISKARKTEEFAKREREIEHKVGLEKKRQEFEIDQAKRETTVAIKEENLAADKERFEEQMKFHEERFKEEVGYLKKMVAQVLERLPSAEIYASIGGGD